MVTVKVVGMVRVLKLVRVVSRLKMIFIMKVKQQEALEDLSTQLKPLLGDSGMMDSNLVGSLVPR